MSGSLRIRQFLVGPCVCAPMRMNDASNDEAEDISTLLVRNINGEWTIYHPFHEVVLETVFCIKKLDDIFSVADSASGRF